MLLLIVTLLFPPCEYEDSMNCYWNADQFGNQTGSSFVDINGTAFALN